MKVSRSAIPISHSPCSNDWRAMSNGTGQAGQHIHISKVRVICRIELITISQAQHRLQLNLWLQGNLNCSQC